MEAMALRRHAIVEILVLRLTGAHEWVDPYYVQAVESILSDAEIDRICTALGHPRFCPGGKPIPMGECCKAKLVAQKPIIMPLSALKPGNTGKVLLVKNSTPRQTEFLNRLGILPGARVSIESDIPALVLVVDHSRVAMEMDMARNIYLLVD